MTDVAVPRPDRTVLDHFVVVHAAAEVTTYLWLQSALKQMDRQAMRWMVKSLVTLKPRPYLLLADANQSMAFAKLSSTIDASTGAVVSGSVSMMAADAELIACRAAGFLVFGSALRMVALDVEGNAVLARYDTNRAKTVLFRCADGRLPGMVREASAIEPLPVYGGRLLSPQAAMAGKKQRIGMLLPTTAGSLCALLPVDPASSQRLRVI